MRAKYQEALRGNCDKQEVIPDFDTIWYPRTCCDDHRKYDARTPGLFKREYEGNEVWALCSKTYLVTQKDPKDFKMSCKGVQKHRVQDPVDIFKNVMETGNAASSVNIGFRARNNTIYTYKQERTAFPYLYCKRLLLEDGRSTMPLDVTLTPREKYAADFEDQLYLSDDEADGESGEGGEGDHSADSDSDSSTLF